MAKPDRSRRTALDADSSSAHELAAPSRSSRRDCSSLSLQYLKDLHVGRCPARRVAPPAALSRGCVESPYHVGMDRDVLVRVLRALEARGVEYAIFGAVALNLHGIVRATQDLDLFVAPDRANVQRLKEALRDVIDDPSIDQITADDLLGDYPAVQYTPPDESFYIDILTRLGEAFSFGDLERERVPFGDLTVTVVTARTLFDMKKNTVRPKDRLDAQLLRERFKLE